MYSRLVVPVDFSDLAWTSVGPARDLATRWGADLELISIVNHERQIEEATADIERYLAVAGWQEGTIVTVLEESGGHVAEVVADHVQKHPGSFVVMTTHGRGRSAAVFGSVAEQILKLVPDPIMVYGPATSTEPLALEGRMVVCVDGTDTSETALDVAAPLSVDLDLELWVVSVAGEVPAEVGGDAVLETAYPHRMANRMTEATGREVEFETLHGKDPARSVADFARTYGVGLIVAATHGRRGLDRLTEGSVAMNIVREAPCPVLLVRPVGAEN